MTTYPTHPVVVMLSDEQLEREIRVADGEYLTRLRGEATRRGLRP
jgi:hypothetical protein